MKKRLIAVIITAVMCLAVLSGCSLMKSFEHDLQVVLMFDGEYYGSCTVNIFNNGVVEKPDAPKGYKFKGWTPQSEWSEDEVDGLEIVTAESGGGLIRYNDVKDYVKEGTECVTLYGVVAPIPQHDIKIAWYGKEGTSGLNQDCMDVFKDNLYGYLSGKGLTPADMDIVIENYGTGDVATTCAKVMDDGDVDIMLGWSTNITTTGGMQDYVIENVGKIKIGSKDRYAARLSDTELCNDVFIWIQNEYRPAPVIPVEPENPQEEYDLIIAWYDLVGTSGLNQTIITNFENGLNSWLLSQGYSDKKVLLRAYDGNVETSCTTIKNNGDVDIMIGWAANITSKGGMVEGTDFIENVADVMMGGKSRYAARLTDSELTNLVFKWITDGNAAEYLKAVAEGV